MNRFWESNDYLPLREFHCQEFYNETKEEIKFRISGYSECIRNLILYHLFGVILLGLPYIFFNLSTTLRSCRYKKCSLEQSTLLLVCDDHDHSVFLPVSSQQLHLPNSVALVELKYFFYKHTKYVWSTEQGCFVPLSDILNPLSVDDHLNNIAGLTAHEYESRRALYGSNNLEIKVKSYWILFIEEIANPFYIFQACSVILWFVDDYMSYALCVVFLTLFSVITSLIQTKKQSEALHNLVESSKCEEVTVLRSDRSDQDVMIKIDPAELVPGDLIVLPAANYTMPCDTVLLTGQCIVNESVLTGESVPVTKTALHSGTELYGTETHKRHTLFSGTHLIQTRYYGGEHVLARAVRTGFETTKGSLVKSILYPTPIGLQFYKDSFKFVLFLAVVAACGMSYCLYLYISRGAEVKEMIVRSLDIVTIVVPPALPAAMAIGTVYSQNRLRKLGIYCISPSRIILCGKTKIVCFDKTGTLTRDGIEMNSVIPSESADFSGPITVVRDLDVNSELVRAMATCHSLTRIDGVLNGDPLDLNMFQFTEWELEEPGEDENARFDLLAPTVVKPHSPENLNDRAEDFKSPNAATAQLPYQIGIIRQFPFSSTLQCMSVICRDLRSPNMVAYVKGAPERLQGMCLPETVPADFNFRLSQYTAKGFRVIAVAYKGLPEKFTWRKAQKSKRDVIECDLIFLGLLIMQNPLKAETAPAVRILNDAKIRTVMITGDNILTGIAVAYDCGMVNENEQILVLNAEDNPDTAPKLTLENSGISRNRENVAVNIESSCHFAVDGRTWSKIVQCYPDFVPHLLVKTAIFARFQPDQKTQVIQFLQKLDYVVCMVGDGANDCGALKAAHVGVSLSQAEASVAAPFTSSIENISCIIYLLLEGRCALVTSFATFKFMALYSFIQFFTVLILYRQHSNLGDYQFFYIDFAVITSLAITIGCQGPSDVLRPKRPPSSLVAAKNVMPLLLQISFCAFVQVASLLYLYRQPWFSPIPQDGKEPVIVSWENSVLFTVSCYQYIVLATLYSKGKPYRGRLITNAWFLLSALSLTIFTTWLVIYPCEWVADLLDLKYVRHDDDERDKYKFRYILLIFPVFHLLVACAIEVCIADRDWLKKLIQCLKCKKRPKNRYKQLLDGPDYRTLLNFDRIRN